MNWELRCQTFHFPLFTVLSNYFFRLTCKVIILEDGLASNYPYLALLDSLKMQYIFADFRQG